MSRAGDAPETWSEGAPGSWSEGPPGSPGRRPAPWIVAAVAVLVAVVGLWSAASRGPEPSLEARTDEVAATLRCPTCAGESVADSAAPMSDAMRTVIADRLRAGESPDEIRTWFTQRYGDGVLLDPPRRGAGWLLWAIPAVLVVGAVALGARRWLTGRRWLVPLAAVGSGAVVAAAWVVSTEGPTGAAVAESEGSDAHGGSASAPAPVSVLRDAVAADPADVELRLALARALDSQGNVTAASDHYGAVARMQPRDADIRYLHAFALERAGEREAAVKALENALTAEPDHKNSLLLLGTLRWRAGDEGGRALLERFLELAPDDPAAADVRRMLDQPVEEAP
ncbi:hypothetical protein GCM10023169_35610 [Georgenia halophila]|uniref:Cytochrome c-type biogenesis protein n=1 Tax=Georgenia halophila TaxID=620889 RepID=A0ABP8LKB1_9MICO